MKDTNLADVFCEVMGGLALGFLCLLVSQALGALDAKSVWNKVMANLSVGVLTGGLIVCYLAGLIADALSLVIGEWFLDDLVSRRAKAVPPNGEQLDRFWRRVSEHALKYRDTQWTYYSLYRSLFILGFPLAVAGMVCLFQRSRPWCAGMVLLGAVVAEVVCWHSMKVLLNLYYRIAVAIAADIPPGTGVPERQTTQAVPLR